MQTPNTDIRTFTLILSLLIAKFLSLGRTMPNRDAIQHIMQGHSAAHILQERTDPAPDRPTSSRLNPKESLIWRIWMVKSWCWKCHPRNRTK